MKLRFALLPFALALGCATHRAEPPRGPRLGDGASCKSAQPLHYQIGLVLDPQHRRLRANVHLEVSCLPEGELRFLLNPHFFLEAAFIDERRVVTSEEAAVSADGLAMARHHLRYRGQSGTPALVELRYEGKLRSTGTPVNDLSEDLIELSRHSGWYPRFDTMRPFTAELSVYAPSRFRVVSLGRAAPSLAVSRVEGGALREWSFNVDEPVLDLVIIGAPHLRSLDVVDREEKVTSYYSTLPSQLVEVVTATLAHGRAYFRAALGEAGGRAASMQIFVPRSGAGYRTSELNVIAEETVRTSSDTADRLLLELSRRWWAVPEDPHVAPGEEDSLAAYYAGRAAGDTRALPTTPPTVALLRTLEQHVGRETLDEVLRQLRLPAVARPLEWPTLDQTLRAAFGDVLLDAVRRRQVSTSEAEEGEEQTQTEHEGGKQ